MADREGRAHGAGLRTLAFVIGGILGVSATLLVLETTPTEPEPVMRTARDDDGTTNAGPVAPGGDVTSTPTRRLDPSPTAPAGQPERAELPPQSVTEAPAEATSSEGQSDDGAPAEPADDEAESRPATTESSAARGVSAEAVKVGVAVPDLGALRHLGPEYDNGDPEEQFEAMLAGWKERGELPIHGRTVEFVYREFDVLDPASQRAACKALIEDEQVFMVIGIQYFRTGAECVAAEFETPLLTSDGQYEAAMARGHPYLFSLGMSNNRMIRNMIHFAEHQGLLEGRPIGIYYENVPEQAQLAREEIPAQLDVLGYEVATTHSTDQPNGGPQDSVAVQKFRQEGVELAILLTSKTGFMQQAEAQRYRPAYVESDHEYGTSDTATSTYPPEHFDGTLAITGRRVGEVSAEMALDEMQRICLETFEKHTDSDRPPPGSAEWSYVLTGCDEGQVLLRGLREAGVELSPTSFVEGLETIHQLPLRRFTPVTFTSDKHHGSVMWRRLKWFEECECWQAQHADYKPLFVD